MLVGDRTHVAGTGQSRLCGAQAGVLRSMVQRMTDKDGDGRVDPAFLRMPLSAIVQELVTAPLGPVPQLCCARKGLLGARAQPPACDPPALASCSCTSREGMLPCTI